MLNLIKADLFSFKKSKVYRNSIIIMLIAILFVICNGGTDKITGLIRINYEETCFGFISGGMVGHGDYMIFFRSALSLILFIIIAMLYIVGDFIITRYNNGEIRNMVAYGHNRYKIYLADMISILLAVIFITVLSVLISMGVLLGSYNVGVPISRGEIIIIIKDMAMILLILSEMVSFYMFLATAIKNKAVIVTIGILSLLLPVIFYNVLDVLGRKLPLFMLMNICGDPKITSSFGTCAVISVIFMLINTILGSLIFNNQEIK